MRFSAARATTKQLSSGTRRPQPAPHPRLRARPRPPCALQARASAAAGSPGVTPEAPRPVPRRGAAPRAPPGRPRPRPPARPASGPRAPSVPCGGAWRAPAMATRGVPRPRAAVGGGVCACVVAAALPLSLSNSRGPARQGGVPLSGFHLSLVFSCCTSMDSTRVTIYHLISQAGWNR